MRDLDVKPMIAYYRIFDHYDAEYEYTNDTKFRIGDFTAINYSYTQNMEAIYSNTETVENEAAFTTSVEAKAEWKVAVVEVGTSVTVGGSLSVTTSSSFTYSTGATVSPRHKATITLYDKGVAILGRKVYKCYDLDGTTFLGYEYEYDSSDCWLPKRNSKTATLSSEQPI